MNYNDCSVAMHARVLRLALPCSVVIASGVALVSYLRLRKQTRACSLDSVTDERIQSMLKFMQETDKLKLVERSVEISGNKRHESTAEHSWHLGIFFILLEKNLPSTINRYRTLKMVLVHDLVEVYAGDTPLYDTVASVPGSDALTIDRNKLLTKQERETAAADKLFSLLPLDLRAEFHGLWTEFEANATPESKIAKCLDKLSPLIQNSVTDGSDYKAHNCTYEGEWSLLEPHVRGSSMFSRIGRTLLDEARGAGWL